MTEESSSSSFDPSSASAMARTRACGGLRSAARAARAAGVSSIEPPLLLLLLLLLLSLPLPLPLTLVAETLSTELLFFFLLRPIDCCERLDEVDTDDRSTSLSSAVASSFLVRFRDDPLSLKLDMIFFCFFFSLIFFHSPSLFERLISFQTQLSFSRICDWMLVIEDDILGMCLFVEATARGNRDDRRACMAFPKFVRRAQIRIGI